MVWNQSLFRQGLNSTLAIVLALLSGCNNESSEARNQVDEPELRKPRAAFIMPRKNSPIEEIDRVLKMDSEFGKKRNHRSETASLETAIKEYVLAVEAIHLGNCPKDFELAMISHLKAWKDSQAFFAEHGALRGEMHDLFDALRENEKTKQTLLAIERDIWGTWAEVEKARKSAQDKAAQDKAAMKKNAKQEAGKERTENGNAQPAK